MTRSLLIVGVLLLSLVLTTMATSKHKSDIIECESVICEGTVSASAINSSTVSTSGLTATVATVDQMDAMTTARGNGMWSVKVYDDTAPLTSSGVPHAFYWLTLKVSETQTIKDFLEEKYGATTTAYIPFSAELYFDGGSENSADSWGEHVACMGEITCVGGSVTYMKLPWDGITDPAPLVMGQSDSVSPIHTIQWIGSTTDAMCQVAPVGGEADMYPRVFGELTFLPQRQALP